MGEFWSVTIAIGITVVAILSFDAALGRRWDRLLTGYNRVREAQDRRMKEARRG